MNIAITKIHHRSMEWIDLDEAAALVHCSKKTIRILIDKMEESRRYPQSITSMVGQRRIIDRLALNDYLRIKDRLDAGLKCEPYDPALQAQLLGFYGEAIKEVAI